MTLNPCPRLARAFAAARRADSGKSPIRPAGAALALARDIIARHEAAKEKAAQARAALESYWQELKATEPKRFAPEGERLAALRKASAAASKAEGWAADFAGHYGGRTVWAKSSPTYGRTSTPGEIWAESAESLFRNVQRAHEADTRLPQGYYDNNYGEASRDGDGLCYGVIGQKRGRAGRPRGVAVYYAGHAFGCNDSPSFDLSRPHMDCDSEEAAKEAARAADAMAETAAESEREYKAAYEAGTQWADKLAEEQEARRKALDILEERRAAGLSGAAFPGLCDVIRRRVSELRESIVESREERAALARGDGGDSWYFYPSDAKLKAAFREGAGLSVYPE